MALGLGVTRRSFLAASATALSALGAGGLTTLLRAQDDAATVPEASGATYLAVAPRVMRAGGNERVAVSLAFDGQPFADEAAVFLESNQGVVAEASGRVEGRTALSLALPAALAEGAYTVRVRAFGQESTAPVRVESGTILFAETDKPIYKPGQTMHLRVLSLDTALKPVAAETTLQVQDAKGITVFKTTVQADQFGLAQADLPLSTEPNLGVWKVRATSGRRTAQRDVRVERYVLPKYEVKLDLPREWALVSDAVSGTVAAEYSFGKPVAGEVEIVAARYVGTWQEYARVSLPIDGRARFEVPPVDFAVGSPGGRGLAQVRLEATVREQGTDYQESATKLVTVASSPVALTVVPESTAVKPGLPFNLLVVSETPDKQPAAAQVSVQVTYTGPSFQQVGQEAQQVTTTNGAAVVQITPPAGTATAQVVLSAQGAQGASLTLNAAYSPTNTFIHVEQVTRGTLQVGQTASFRVRATSETRTIYYEVVARGQVVYSDTAGAGGEIDVPLSPEMAPEARLIAYTIVGGSEVTADYIPFKVEGQLPGAVTVRPSAEEVRPGQELEVAVEAAGPARIGLAAVDRSVYILAENRLNLRQVFDELEKLYGRPQAELHDVRPIPGGPEPIPLPRPVPGAVPPREGRPAAPVLVAPAPPRPFGSGGTQPGAEETFRDAGLVVLTNRTVPKGRSMAPPMPIFAAPAAAGAERALPAAKPAASPAAVAQTDPAGPGLAEVERVRQFFPETWVWSTFDTDGAGQARQTLTAPDSITTWMFRAVALSPQHGFGIGEAQLRVFQPFFAQVDLPFSAIRGEELPVRVALYNYADSAQELFVDLEGADWFDLLDDAVRSVVVAPNSVGGISFRVRPRGLGARAVKVTARSQDAADAIVKEILVEPEGVARETVENLVLAAGANRALDMAPPPQTVPGSARVLFSATGNVLGQSIEGLENLLKMPYGCGEQNMILFAPNVFVARYLKETGQSRPEVMAKAELLMLTGYQRQLTYRRTDASFSAFGQSDPTGSLWLTAFVLKTFAQARDLLFVDDGVLASARGWIGSRQNGDGSFDPVGFVHHQELLGGLNGRTALTAYVAIALREAGDEAAATRAISYLEGRLGQTTDAYGLAIATYALALARSPRAAEARDRLLAIARESDEGLWWDDPRPRPLDADETPAGGRPVRPGPRPVPARSAAVETTAYGVLALLALGDNGTASRAVRWLAARRNAQGGFGSTQDTVVALQALATAAALSRSDVDATITLRADGWSREIRVNPSNADVLQVVEVPAGVTTLDVATSGRGQVLSQAVLRYNLPAAQASAESAFSLDVRYGAENVAVNDLLDVTATVTFTPPIPVAAGMVVVDVSIPTGFEAYAPSLERLARAPRVKRHELAGRKVIVYVEDLQPGEQINLAFQARALYPVRAQAVASQAYAYYRPEWSGESLGGALVVA